MRSQKLIPYFCLIFIMAVSVPTTVMAQQKTYLKSCQQI